MTDLGELSDYNRAAMAFADTLQQHRNEQHRAIRSTSPTIEGLLPGPNRAAIGVHREHERMGFEPVSDELAADARRHGVTFEHLGLTLGTVLHGLDLRSVPTAEVIALIRRTLLERPVVFFRDQNLDQAQQVAFARQFGDLDAFPFGKPGEDPFILEIIHGKTSPGTENGWHTDVTWMERPSLGSVAQCIEVPPIGGDTLFSDSHAAYLALPDELRERVEHLSGVNDYRFFLGSRAAKALPAEDIDTLKKQIPFGVEHPLVRTHPETGKQALYIHGQFLRHDSLFDARTRLRLDAKESREIVARLLTMHGRPEYSCRFRCEPGSIAFWDNRAVQHYAASDYYPHRRVLRRVTISGDRPFHNVN